MLIDMASTRAAILVALRSYGMNEEMALVEGQYCDPAWGTADCDHMELSFYLRGLGLPSETRVVRHTRLAELWNVQAQQGYQVFGLFKTGDERAEYQWAFPAQGMDGAGAWVLAQHVGTGHLVGKIAGHGYTGVYCVVNRELPPQDVVVVLER